MQTPKTNNKSAKRAKITDAELVSLLFWNDGQCWRAPETNELEISDGRTISVVSDRGEQNGWATELTEVLVQACISRELNTERELTRYELPDGSAIVVVGGAWDIEGVERFSWRGAQTQTQESNNKSAKRATAPVQREPRVSYTIDYHRRDFFGTGGASGKFALVTLQVNLKTRTLFGEPTAYRNIQVLAQLKDDRIASLFFSEEGEEIVSGLKAEGVGTFISSVRTKLEEFLIECGSDWEESESADSAYEF